jgi:hypothetical protein
MPTQQGGPHRIVAVGAIDHIEGMGGHHRFAAARTRPSRKPCGRRSTRLAPGVIAHDIAQCADITQTQVHALPCEWMYRVGCIAQQDDAIPDVGFRQLALQGETRARRHQSHRAQLAAERSRQFGFEHCLLDCEQTLAFSDGLAKLSANNVPLLRPLRTAGFALGDSQAWLQGWLVGGAMGYRGDIPQLCRKRGVA